jgi:hypothetical protein
MCICDQDAQEEKESAENNAQPAQEITEVVNMNCAYVCVCAWMFVGNACMFVNYNRVPVYRSQSLIPW